MRRVCNTSYTIINLYVQFIWLRTWLTWVDSDSHTQHVYLHWFSQRHTKNRNKTNDISASHSLPLPSPLSPYSPFLSPRCRFAPCWARTSVDEFVCILHFVFVIVYYWASHYTDYSVSQWKQIAACNLNYRRNTWNNEYTGMKRKKKTRTHTHCFVSSEHRTHDREIVFDANAIFARFVELREVRARAGK